jgi:agmatine/peptidylarginine deiminase
MSILVRMIATPRDVEEARRRCCGPPGGAPGGIEIVCMPTDDSWTRDSAPTFLLDRDGALGAVEWRCTSYGALHRDCAETAKMAGRLMALTGARGFRAPIALEGGAVHTDGRGTLLTTEDVVLDERRNPGLTKADTEDILREAATRAAAGGEVYCPAPLGYAQDGRRPVSEERHEQVRSQRPACLSSHPPGRRRRGLGR